jgi:regulator of sirC expression with transglutaminase-like and TPR domain
MSRPTWSDPPLAAVVHGGRLECSLEEAALVLARQEFPSLDPKGCLEQLDTIAARVRPLLSQQPDIAETIGAVSDVLFRDLRFRGNTANYNDPNNSFLNQVLERRTGIPITLAVVYMAIARRVGATLQGTNFPGHFLLVAPRTGWPIVLDAFDGGRILSPQECLRLAARVGVVAAHEPPQAVSEIAILRRMLENLRNIYTATQDWERLLRTSAQILVVTPKDAEQHRIQGIALAALGMAGQALAAFDRYLTQQPDADDADAIREVQRRLREDAGEEGSGIT